MRRGTRRAVVIACIAAVAMAAVVGTEGIAGAAPGKPSAPTDVVAQPGNTTATVSWMAPGTSGGSPITGYIASAGSKTCTTTGALTCTITGLRNGQTYKVKVKAVNSEGKGASSTKVDVEPGLPGAPSGVLTTSENAKVLVSWTAAADNGFAISNYNVVASPGPHGCNTATMTSCTVSGLTNGTSYTFTVSATNAKGTGAASAPSAPTIPATVPGAPTGVSATAGITSASVSFTAPASNGGSAITSYTVKATDTTTPGNGGQTGSGSGSPITVSGLTGGDSYTFTVTATNGVGTGLASTASTPVTPTSVPGAPTGVSATAGNASASVSFSPPASAGGSAIISYTVTATDETNPSDPSNGSTATGAGSPITISGLQNGDSYTFTVTATNGVGTGQASSPSTAVTPATVPDAPTGVSAVPDGSNDAGVLVVSFTPGFDEGSPVIADGYTVTITDQTNPNDPNNGLTVDGDAAGDPVTVSGLTSGDTYSFTVTATNSVGTSASSLPSTGVTSP